MRIDLDLNSFKQPYKEDIKRLATLSSYAGKNVPIIVKRSAAILYRGPFIQGWLDEMQSQIDKDKRIWLPNQKIWLFDRDCKDTVLRITREYCQQYYYIHEGDIVEFANVQIGRGKLNARFNSFEFDPSPNSQEKPKQIPNTLYTFLGVKQNAKQGEIKRAYRRKAKEYHPDTPTGDADKFIRLKQAYEKLSDPKKRKKYDATLHLLHNTNQSKGILDFI